MGVLGDLWKGASGRSDERADVPSSKSFGYAKGGMAAERAYEREQQYQARDQQNQMNDFIARRARGEGGPSVAELQMQRGLGQAQSAIRSQAGGARGMSRALAQSNAQNAMGTLASQNTANTGLLRAQEQIAAQELAQRGYGQARSQDLQNRGLGLEESLGHEGLRQQAYATNAGVGQGNAQRGQGIYTLLAAAGLGAAAASDVKHKEIIDRGMPSDFSKKEVYSDFSLKEPVPGAQPVTGPQGLPLDMQYLNVPEAPGPQETDAAMAALDQMKASRQAPQIAPPQSSSVGGDAATGFNIGSAIGGMFSDFRGKEVSPERSREDLQNVIPTDYRYKPEASIRMALEQAQGAALSGASPEAIGEVVEDVYEDKRAPRCGIVAQDLQRSPAFRDSVVQGEAGLAVNRDRALSTALYELGGLDKRLKALEGGNSNGMPSDFNLKEPARLGEVAQQAPVSEPSQSPEVRQDFADLEAMLKAQEAPRAARGGNRPAAAATPSQAEMYVQKVMQGSPQSQAPTFEPRSEVIRDESGGGGEVLVQDYGMKSDFSLKDFGSWLSSKTTGQPKMRRSPAIPKGQSEAIRYQLKRREDTEKFNKELEEKYRLDEEDIERWKKETGGKLKPYNYKFYINPSRDYSETV